MGCFNSYRTKLSGSLFLSISNLSLWTSYLLVESNEFGIENIVFVSQYLKPCLAFFVIVKVFPQIFDCWQNIHQDMRLKSGFFFY